MLTSRTQLDFIWKVMPIQYEVNGTVAEGRFDATVNQPGVTKPAGNPCGQRLLFNYRIYNDTAADNILHSRKRNCLSSQFCDD